MILYCYSFLIERKGGGRIILLLFDGENDSRRQQIKNGVDNTDASGHSHKNNHL